MADSKKITITPDEYPPQYEGIKENGDIKMVYRIDGEMGLVWHEINHRESEYRWEHFVLIQKYK